jgi:hypothetical protein
MICPKVTLRLSPDSGILDHDDEHSVLTTPLLSTTGRASSDHRQPATTATDMAKLQGTRLGAYRAYSLGFFVCLAGFMFGYDTGIVGRHASMGTGSAGIVC